jgi:hypothetical protein
VVNVSVDLSRQPFVDGALQMENLISGKIIHQIRSTSFGDALLFRISGDLTHRVHRVVGEIPTVQSA